MNRSRLSLFMQVFTILPTVGFLILYAHGLVYGVLTVVLLLLLAINIYKYFKDLTLIEYPVLAILVGSFYLYTFHGLGNIQTPQTFHTLKEGQSVTLFDFEKPVTIDKVCYYVGIDKNVNFTLERRTQNSWKKFYT